MLYQPPPRVTYSPPHISTDGTNLNAVEHFTYLGSVISNDATVSKDLDNRLSKASSSFGRCQREYGRVTRSASPQISRYTGPSSFPPPILCGAETWVLYWKQMRLLERFYQRCLRSILGIKWQDHVSNESLQESQPARIESILLQVQLRWAGHVTKMEDVRIPKAVFLSELQEGKRDRGAPRKHYKDQLKRQLAQAGIGHQSWQQASDRDSWRSSVRNASCEFEAERHKATKEKRRRQKEQAPPLHPHPKPPSVQSAVGVRINNRSLQPQTSMQDLTINPANNPRLQGMSHHHSTEQWVGF